jgi:hypothetical protein
MTQSRLLTRASGLLTAALLTAGCASGHDGEGTVFTVVTGFSQTMPATTVDVVDVGVPDLTNVSSDTIKIRGVSLVSAGRWVHLASVTAYGLGGGVGLVHGDLLKYCRTVNQPYPVTRDVTPPRSGSRWDLVLAITFARPGIYHLARVRISYTANGRQGWQYQNLSTTITITAARRGTKPAFDGCP